MGGLTREDSIAGDRLVFEVFLWVLVVLRDEDGRSWCLLGAFGWAEAS